MVPSRQPDVLHLLRTIAPIIVVDYNAFCHANIMIIIIAVTYVNKNNIK